MGEIGILAYGSLIDNPGSEIQPLIKERIKNLQTPFRVEFARKSESRGDAPTLIPVEEGGAQINAQILILKHRVSEQEAMNLLWRRETRQENSNKRYNPSARSNTNRVTIIKIENFKGIEKVFYTSIGQNIENLTPDELSRLAIKSVRKTDNGEDGISYLINAKNNGILTPLMPQYESEILKKTSTKNLESALLKIKRKS